MEKKVTYQKWYGILMICMSALLFFMNTITGFGIYTITVVITMVLGILYLSSAAIVYNERELQLKSLIGHTVSTYPISKGQMEVKEGTIYTNGKKLRMAKWLLHTHDYQELLAFIQTKT